jgi:hypothetical protein
LAVRERSCSEKIVSSSALLLHEVTNELRNLIRGGIECEMASIEEVNIGFRRILAVPHVTASE